MEISIETDDLVKAVADSKEAKAKIAYMADLSPATLQRVLDADHDVIVSTIGKVADYLGFKTKITFERKNATTV